MTLLQVYFAFDGRIGRQTYWLKGVLLLIAIAVPASILVAILTLGIGLLILLPLMWWVGLAVAVKRWHDRGKSGWWVLIGFIPVIGPIWAFIETGLLPGDRGPNAYGDRAY